MVLLENSLLLASYSVYTMLIVMGLIGTRNTLREAKHMGETSTKVVCYIFLFLLLVSLVGLFYIMLK